MSHRKKNKEVLEYEVFRLNATAILCLCCPSLKENFNINEDEELFRIMTNLPTINESLILSVLTTLKSCKYLRGIVGWLPLETNCNLVKTLIASNSFSWNTFELMELLVYGMVFSVQLADSSESFVQCVEELQEYFKKAFLSVNKEESMKNSAYLFKLTTASLITFMHYISGHKLRNYSEMGMLYDANYHLDRPYFLMEYENQKKSAMNIVEILFKNCESFVVDISPTLFCEWDSFKTDLFEMPKKLLFESLSDFRRPDNLYVHISINFHKILTIFLNDDWFCMPHLNEYQKFKTFMEKQVNTPSFTPDTSLNFDELTKDSDIRLDDKQFELLLQNDKIFSYSKLVPLIRKNFRLLPVDTMKKLIVNAIQYCLEENEKHSPEWHSMILEYGKHLDHAHRSSLVEIIKLNLANGSIEVLKNDDFSECLTKVFNQLDSSNNTINTREFMSLGLQAGAELVSRTLSHIFEMPGLEELLMSALEDLSSVCITPNEKGLSLATVFLNTKISEIISTERKRCFVSVSVKFLKIYHKDVYSIGRKTILIFPNEMFEHVLLKNLHCHESFISLECEAVIEILEVILEMFPKVVFNPNKKFASLFVSLTLMYSIFFCESFNVSVDTRCRVCSMLKAFSEEIMNNRETYVTEILQINTVLQKYSLHPRCYILICECITGNKYKAESYCDEVFHELHKIEEFSLEGMEKLTKDKYKWTYSLLKILPMADEVAWVRALSATHVSIMKLMTYSKIIHTLDMLCLVLRHKCKEYREGPLKADKIADLQNCLFINFASAVVIYMSDILADLPLDEKVETICSVASWWCKSVHSFESILSVHIMVLSRLVNFLTGEIQNHKSKSINQSNADQTLPSEEKGFKTSSPILDGDVEIGNSLKKLTSALEFISDAQFKDAAIRQIKICFGD